MCFHEQKADKKKIHIASNSSRSSVTNFLIHIERPTNPKNTEPIYTRSSLGYSVSVLLEAGAGLDLAEQPRRPLWPASSSSYARRTYSSLCTYIYQNLSSVPAFTRLRVRDSSLDIKVCYTVASSSCVNKCYSILEYSIYEKFVTKIHFRLVRKKAKFVAGRFFFLRQLCHHQKRLDLKKLLWWPPRSEAVLFSNTPSPSNITQKILEDNKKSHPVL